MERFFLNIHEPLVSAVSDWLAARVRATPGGVPSLCHLLVIVPTRQAGRRLRLALAARTSGCLPPLVRLPAQVIVPARAPDPPVATPAEFLALLSRFLLDLPPGDAPHLIPSRSRPTDPPFAWALGVARQLTDLWGILQENALTMADVAARAETLLAGEDLDVEVARWRELAQLESRFFDLLRARGRTPAPLARQQAVADPLFPDGVEGIVLPALADAQPALYPALDRLAGQGAALTVLIHADPADDARFDRWGRPEPDHWLGEHAPRLPLDDGQIVLAANSVEQARIAAALVAAVPADREPPALGMADDTLFPELQSAFLAHGLTLHNPAAYPLAASALGRLIAQLEALAREPRFPVLSAFLREADVQRWLESRLADTHPGIPCSDLLRALDELQNAHLPQTLDAARDFCAETRDAAKDEDAPRWAALLAALDAVAELLAPHGQQRLAHLTAQLQMLFAARTLCERAPGDRELAAAAEAALAVFDALDADLVASVLDDVQRANLFDALLAAATYQLEPEGPDARLTEGWLELHWSAAPDLVVTGFNEGCVPDAVVGHAFLPDRLRQGLGLTDNARRAARDTYLLASLLASRPAGAVRLLLERVSTRNDVRKPSRLLFLCDDDTLAARARTLFRDAEASASGHPRALPDAWRLALPVPETPPDRLSVTAFKSYLACPFTFYLRHILGMEPADDRRAELDAPAFGTLCHDALENFGRSELKDSSDADAITAFLEDAVWSALRRQCGKTLSAVLRLQGSAACKRLSFFARRQTALHDEGWRIVHVERDLATTAQGLLIRGRADRLDRHEATGAWRIIDYKTWDRFRPSDGPERFTESGKAMLDYAASRGFEPFLFGGKPRVWSDLQLPLYLQMAQAGGLVDPCAKVECGYFVLGETDVDTGCRAWEFAELQDTARATLRRAVDDIRAGIFWPPSPRREWQRDYAALFLDDPETGLSAAWIADQQRRFGARNGGAR